MAKTRPPGETSRSGVSAPVISFDKVTKRFGSNVALSDVCLDGVAGSVHAITGENGAGKSTLMNLLAGVHRPDEGRILLRGEAVWLDSPHHAQRLGISTIFQELTLLPNLTVAENLFLGREPAHRGMVDRRAMRARAEVALRRLGSRIGVDEYCGELSVADQQLVEIAKGISADADIFIFDEPTAALNAPEVEKLGELIASLKAEGKLIFYVSHRLDEIFEFCDQVSVLKDGLHVATRAARDLTHDELISLMVGRVLTQFYPARKPPQKSLPSALDVSGLIPVAGGMPLSFVARRGEVLGLSGLEGQGQRDIIRALAGLQPAVQGHVTKSSAADGGMRPLDLTVVATALAGVGFVPEDRKSEGLYLSLSISENIVLGMLRRFSVWERARVRTDLIAGLMERMRVRATSPKQLVGMLSGGNQQKVMIGRWLASGVDVLLLEEPTRGVDIGAKAEIYALLRDFADGGGAVVLTSSELQEVLGLCDRVLVIRGGMITAELDGATTSEEEVMRFALTEQSSAARTQAGRVNA